MDTGVIADRWQPRPRSAWAPEEPQARGAMKTGFATPRRLCLPDADLPFAVGVSRAYGYARVRRRHRQRVPVRPHGEGRCGPLHGRLNAFRVVRCPLRDITSVQTGSAASSTTSNCTAGPFATPSSCRATSRLEIIQFGVISPAPVAIESGSPRSRTIVRECPLRKELEGSKAAAVVVLAARTDFGARIRGPSEGRFGSLGRRYRSSREQFGRRPPLPAPHPRWVPASAAAAMLER